MNKMVYLKLIGFGVALTFLVSFFSALGVIMQMSDNGMILCQSVAFFIAAICLTYYMKKKDRTLRLFGFQKKPIDKRLYLIIGLIILVQPLVLGINFSLTWKTMSLIVLQMVLVGYTEEVLFRGIYLYALQERSPRIFICFSSCVFGVLHLASGLNPNVSLFLICLQIINALLLGAVFATIYFQVRTIYLVIAFHTLFNTFASITLVGTLNETIFVVILLSVIYIMVLLYLWFTPNHDKKATID